MIIKDAAKEAKQEATTTIARAEGPAGPEKHYATPRKKHPDEELFITNATTKLFTITEEPTFAEDLPTTEPPVTPIDHLDHNNPSKKV